MLPLPQPTSSIREQAGETTTLGDPTVVATAENTRPTPVEPSPPEEEVVQPTGPRKRDVKLIRPRPKKPDLPAGTALPRRGITVSLALTINKKGRVVKVDIIDKAGEPFDSLAVAYGKKLRFKPEIRNYQAKGSVVPYDVIWKPK